MINNGPDTNAHEILIVDLAETIQCDLVKTESTRTCKIRGRVIGEGWMSDWTTVLLDSGASYSCVSDTFLSTLSSRIEVFPTKRPSAVDASNRLITARGDCFLTLSLKSETGRVELRRIRFAVFPSLSVSILIGCEILSLLDFRLSNNCAFLKNHEIPRLMALETKKCIDFCELDLVNAVVIEKESQFFTLLEAQIDEKCFASFPDGEVIIHLLDSFTGNAVISPDKTGRYTTMQPVRTDDHGELKARSILFTLDGHCSEIPMKLRALVAELPCVPVSSSPHILTVNETQSTERLSKEHMQAMLSGTQLDKGLLEKLLAKFQNIFALTENDLGEFAEPVALQLRDPSATPKYCKPRCVPYDVREWLDKKLKDMIDAGLIEISKGSAFNSPAHIVRKKQPGKYRLTVDYRYLNGLLRQNRWPLPHIRTVLEHLSGSRYFSVMDCRSGFWQLRLTEESRSITAFSCRGRQYEWKRLPMGLSVSPGLFQSVMMRVFSEDVFRGIIVYVDDILIYTRTKEEHYKLIAKAFSKLRAAGVKLHPEKSSFGKSTVEYLGYEIGSFGYRPLKSKVDAILAMARPKTKTELKSFIGSVTFYTQSLPLLQYTLAPLHSISGSTDKFVWNTEQEEAFEKAKAILQGLSLIHI